MASRLLVLPQCSATLSALVAVLLLAHVPARADLRSTTLSALVGDSRHIVLAEVSALDGAPRGRGGARLKPLQAIKGALPADPLALQWSDEVHEQRVPAPPAQVLLFLSATLTATHYGRSYWPIEHERSAGARCTRYVRYQYPIDLLRLDADQRRRLLQTLPVRQGTAPVRILCLDDWQALTQAPAATRTPR